MSPISGGSQITAKIPAQIELTDVPRCRIKLISLADDCESSPVEANIRGSDGKSTDVTFVSPKWTHPLGDNKVDIDTKVVMTLNGVDYSDSRQDGVASLSLFRDVEIVKMTPNGSYSTGNSKIVIKTNYKLKSAWRAQVKFEGKKT
jgi:hypothetical protein